MNRVRAIDEAQSTRFIPVPYAPAREVFLDQLIKQGVEPEIVAYASRFKEVAPEPSAVDLLPETRVVNWRNFMLYAQLYTILKEDPIVRMAVNTAMFGPGAVHNLEQCITDELPLSPEEFLESVSAIASRDTVTRLLGSKRTDLVGVALHRLIHHLNQSTVHLTNEQTDNLAELALFLPDQFSSLLLRRLIANSAPRQEYYLDILTHWHSPDGRTAGPVGMKIHEANRRIMARTKAFDTGV